MLSGAARQLGRAEPGCLNNARIKWLVCEMPHRPAVNAKPQVSHVGGCCCPLVAGQVNTNQRPWLNLPAGFLAGFANNRVQQALGRIKVTGRLVQPNALVGMLPHEQATAVLFDHGGHRDTGDDIG